MDTFRLNKLVSSYIGLARPYNLAAALLSFAIGCFFYRPAHNGLELLLGLLIIALLHSSANAQNDIYDTDVDRSNKRTGAIVTGLVTVQSAEILVTGLIASALIVASFSQHKLGYLIFIVLLVVAAWLYNSPPLQLSRKPFSSIAVLALYYTTIPLLFGWYAAGGGHIKSPFILICIFLTLQRFSISLLKDYKDIKGDRQHNKRTFLAAYGHKATAITSNLLCWISYPLVITILASSLKRGPSKLVALVILIVVAMINIVNRFGLLLTTDNSRLNRIFQKSFVGENYFMGVAVACLILL